MANTKITATAMNNNTRSAFFSEVMAKLPEGVQTDVTAVTVPLEREDGKIVYATVKVTLHKEDFDLDEKVAEFKDIMDTRAKREAELAEKKAKSEAKKAEKAAKGKDSKATGMSLSPAYDKGE